MSNADDHNPQFRTPSDPATRKGYELSGKIMLSAIIVLFVVVVFMLLLHIYARWYLLRSRRRRRHHHRRRRTHLVFYVEPTNPGETFSFPQRGLDPLLLKSIPTFTFAAGEDRESSGLECAVCLSEFEEGESVRRLPKCDHCFHVDCIDMWFHSHDTCPLCRAPVAVAGEVPAPVSEVVVEVELTESTRASSELEAESRPGPSSSSSFGARGKEIGVSIEVPARSASFSFSNSDELGPSSPGGFKSPTSRLLALKRMLSREKKPIPIQSPTLSPSCSGIGTSCAELAEIEEGRGENRTSQTRPETPR